MSSLGWIRELKRETGELVAQGRFSEAIQVLKRWVSEKLLFQASTQVFAEFCCSLSNDLLVQDHAEAALAMLQFAAKHLHQPRLRAMVFHACGAHFYNRGMFNLAAKHFKDALDADAREPGISPNSNDKVTTLISLATSLIQMGERDQAFIYLNKALDFSKNVYPLRDLHQTANTLILSLNQAATRARTLVRTTTLDHPAIKKSRQTPITVTNPSYEIKRSLPASSGQSRRSSIVSEDESIDGSILAERETAKFKVALVDRPRFKRVDIVVTHKSGKQKKVVLGDEELRHELANLNSRDSKLDLDSFWRDIVQGVDVRLTKSQLTVQVVLPSQQSELPAVHRLLQGLPVPHVADLESATKPFRSNEASKIEEQHSSVESGYRILPNSNRPRPLSAQEKLTEGKLVVKWSSRPQSAKGPKPKRFFTDTTPSQHPLPYYQYHAAFARQKRPVSSKDRKHRREHIEDGDNLYVYDDEGHMSELEDEFDEEHEVVLLDEADPELVDNENSPFCAL
jgi:tetratricopeptide (TPR) repeat protein